MSKNVQISAELFDMLCEYFLDDSTDDHTKGFICKNIQQQLCEKIEKMVTREAFTEYKTAQPGSEQREEARLRYLKRIGMRKGFITDEETFGL